MKSSPLVQYLNSQMELIPYLTFLENSDIFETGFLSLAVAFFLPSKEGADESAVKLQERNNFQLFKKIALHYELSSFFYTDNEDLLKSFHITVIRFIRTKFFINFSYVLFFLFPFFFLFFRRKNVF
jgi:hypothetical protein